jgi:ribonuclease-3
MEGPPHAPEFRYSVLADDHTLGEGCGTSKQNAQQAAARDALRRLKNQ